MAQEYKRTQRIAKEIKKNISIILQKKIKDNRINMATISKVEISRDLSYAKIFFTLLYDTPEQIKISVQVLKNASGFIRFLLSKNMCLRRIMEINFIYDNSLVEGIKIYNIIKKNYKFNE